LKVSVSNVDASGNDSKAEGCEPQFLLQVWNPSSTPPEWVSKDQMGEILKA
jgi:hypothetical protein